MICAYGSDSSSLQNPGKFQLWKQLEAQHTGLTPNNSASVPESKESDVLNIVNSEVILPRQLFP